MHMHDTCICMCICTNVNVGIHMYVYIDSCMHACMYVYVCMHVRKCTFVRHGRKGADSRLPSPLQLGSESFVAALSSGASRLELQNGERGISPA